MKVPCGKTLGFGQSCSADYLCESCLEIGRLRAKLAEAESKAGELVLMAAAVADEERG